MNKLIKKGFTLAEVMIALLVIAVILAASTPIITKNTIRTRGGAGNNPWGWVGNSQNAVFNKDGHNSAAAIIGSGTIPPVETVSQWDDSILPSPRLVINTDGVVKPISFYQASNRKGDINVTEKGCFLGVYPNLSESEITNTVAIGNVTSCNSSSVAIGENVSASAVNSVGIGHGASAAGINSIAIGNNASASADDSVAIGANSSATGVNAVAIGLNSAAAGVDSLALGKNAIAVNAGSFAIGRNCTSYGDNSIFIGHDVASTTLSYEYKERYVDHEGSSIHGDGHHQVTFETVTVNLSPSGAVVLGSEAAPMSSVLYGTSYTGNFYVTHLYASNLTTPESNSPSDARLKNVGSKYTSGMNEINQLKVYNYTFKNNPKKKRVGVIAQDLMKIFPNAVSKGDDGYYVIREEDIFYAMVNAIKELDRKISAIIESLKNPSEKCVELANKVSDLETEIKQQKNDIRNLKRRILFLKLRTICLK